jgi:hypothetical protein
MTAFAIAVGTNDPFWSSVLREQLMLAMMLAASLASVAIFSPDVRVQKISTVVTIALLLLISCYVGPAFVQAERKPELFPLHLLGVVLTVWFSNRQNVWTQLAAVLACAGPIGWITSKLIAERRSEPAPVFALEELNRDQIIGSAPAQAQGYAVFGNFDHPRFREVLTELDRVYRKGDRLKWYTRFPGGSLNTQQRYAAFIAELEFARKSQKLGKFSDVYDKTIRSAGPSPIPLEVVTTLREESFSLARLPIPAGVVLVSCPPYEGCRVAANVR